jgi:hypothetical protein
LFLSSVGRTGPNKSSYTPSWSSWYQRMCTERRRRVRRRETKGREQAIIIGRSEAQSDWASERANNQTWGISDLERKTKTQFCGARINGPKRRHQNSKRTNRVWVKDPGVRHRAKTHGPNLQPTYHSTMYISFFLFVVIKIKKDNCKITPNLSL